MTTTSEQADKDKAEAVKTRNAEMEVREKALNAERSGKGLRVFLGMTRGRNPQEIQFEQWDESQPETLPASLSEFMDLRKSASEEKDIVKRLILGDNDVLYSEASDPVSEFVDASWDADVQARFKVSIRNFSRDSGLSIEEAVAIIKPSVVAAQAKK